MKTALNSSFCAVTADLKSSWSSGKKASFAASLRWPSRLSSGHQRPGQWQPGVRAGGGDERRPVTDLVGHKRHLHRSPRPPGCPAHGRVPPGRHEVHQVWRQIPRRPWGHGVQGEVIIAIWALERGTAVVIANGTGEYYHTIRDIIGGRKLGTFFTMAKESESSVEEQASKGSWWTRPGPVIARFRVVMPPNLAPSHSPSPSPFQIFLYRAALAETTWLYNAPFPFRRVSSG